MDVDDPVFGDKRLPVRFWAKVKATDTCWNWQAYKGQGYGRLTMRELLEREAA